MKSKQYGIAFCMALVVLGAILYAEAPWKQVKSGEGITIFTRDIEGSDIDEFRGVAMIQAAPEVVNNVLDDIPSFPSWMPDCVASEIVERSSGDIMTIYYQVKVPWPLDNRDVVFYNKVTKSPDMIIRKFHAVIHPKCPPRKGVVRMTLMTGQWTIVKKDGGSHVTYQVKSNPAGNIPASIANMASRDMPFKTLRALRNMVRLSRYQQK